jgi:hypothetical protein
MLHRSPGLACFLVGVGYDVQVVFVVDAVVGISQYTLVLSEHTFNSSNLESDESNQPQVSDATGSVPL